MTPKIPQITQIVHANHNAKPRKTTDCPYNHAQHCQGLYYQGLDYYTKTPTDTSQHKQPYNFIILLI